MINFPMSFALGKLVHKITQGSIYWADITSVFDGKAYKGASPGPIALSRCRCARYLNYFSLISSQHLVTFIYFASEQHQVFHNVTWYSCTDTI